MWAQHAAVSAAGFVASAARHSLPASGDPRLARVRSPRFPRCLRPRYKGGVQAPNAIPIQSDSAASRPTELALSAAPGAPREVLSPAKIIGVGVNYRAHAREMGKTPPAEPLLFLKPPSALIGPEAVIELPAGFERIDFEAELGVVVGWRGRAIPRERALEWVLGYTCVNDVTVRDLQAREGQWARAKGFDTFCPIGPRVACDLDASDVAIQSRVGGEIRQDSRTSDLIFSIPELIAFASSAMTLEPGDVIATGTPSGVGPLHPGDRVEIEIEGIGVLANSVKAA